MARIADFIGLGTDEARIDVAAHLSSFEYMAAHKEPFSDPRLRKRSESAAAVGTWRATHRSPNPER